LHNLWAHYAGEVDLTDKHIGRILRMVKDTGIWDDTMIVFTTDHGMYIGEHNCAGKSNINPGDDRGNWPLLDEVCHTPLMIKPAGGRKVAESNALVQPVDLTATILDAFGAMDQGVDAEGMSLAPLLEGRQEWPREMAISAQCVLAGNKDNPQTPNWATVNDGEWTLAFGGKESDRNQLYRTAEDPLQQKNLFEQEREVADRMFNYFIDYIRKMGAADDRVALYQKIYAKD